MKTQVQSFNEPTFITFILSFSCTETYIIPINPLHLYFLSVAQKRTSYQSITFIHSVTHEHKHWSCQIIISLKSLTRIYVVFWHELSLIQNLGDHCHSPRLDLTFPAKNNNMETVPIIFLLL